MSTVMSRMLEKSRPGAVAANQSATSYHDEPWHSSHSNVSGDNGCLGANCARHLATLGEVQPELPQVNGTRRYDWPRPAQG
jgi:hypothetical protein